MSVLKVLMIFTMMFNIFVVNKIYAADISMTSAGMLEQTRISATRCIDGSYVFNNSSFSYNADKIKNLQSYQDALAAGAKSTGTACDYKTFGVSLPGSGSGVVRMETKDMYPRYENVLSSEFGSTNETLRLGDALVLKFSNHSAHDSRIIEQLHKCLLLIQSGKVNSFWFYTQTVGSQGEGFWRYGLSCEVN